MVDTSEVPSVAWWQHKRKLNGPGGASTPPDLADQPQLADGDIIA